MRKGIFLLFVLIGITYSCQNDPEGDKDNSESAQKNHEGVQNSPDPVSYEIAKEKDLSSPIPTRGKESMGTVTKKKIQYFLIVGDSLKREQVKPTINKAVKEITQENPDVDEAILYLCSTEGTVTSGNYDVGKAVWAPKGELGNITAEIAQKDIRKNYEISLEVRDNLEENLKKKRNTSKKFGLTEEKRKEIYKALVKAGDRGIKEADEKYSVTNDKHSKATDSLMKKYKKQVREKYGISEDVAEEISMEGFDKKWPQPEF